MQIRTIFHNANFLKKSTPNADERAAVKASRRLVCVLLMLVMCAGAVCEDEYRWKNDSQGGNWDIASNWEKLSGTEWVTATEYPQYGNVTFRGAPGANIEVTLPSSFSGEKWFGNIIINSSSAGPYTLKLTSGNTASPPTLAATNIYIPGSDGSNVSLVFNNVNLRSTGEFRINDDNDTDSADRYDGTIAFSGTGSIQAVKLMIFGDASANPSPSCVNFNDVSVTTDTLEINWDEKTGTVEVATDSSIVTEKLWIGKADGENTWAGEANTTTVFSGTGSITTNKLDYPNSNNHTMTLNSGVSFNFSQYGGITTQEGSVGILTINGSGTMDLGNVSSQSNTQTLQLSPELNVQNVPSGLQIYTYSLSSVDLTVLPASSTTITISASVTSGTFAPDNKIFAYTLEKIGTGSASFSFNGSTEDGSVSLTLGSGTSFSGTFDIACSGSVTSGEGFKLTIKKPGEAILGVIEWTKQGVSWTGAVSAAWENTANWSGVSAIADLANEDIVIEGTYTNAPEIGSGISATVKSLTIESGKQITLSGGSLTVTETFENKGTFTSTGGTLTAGKYAGTGGYNISGNTEIASTGSGSSNAGSINAITTSSTADTTFTKSGDYTIGTFTTGADHTTTLASDLAVTTLTNNGIIDTNGQELSFGTLSDTGTIKIGAAGDLSAGTANQTVNNLVFTAGRSFNGFTNINLKNVELSAGTLTLGNNFTPTGTLTNNGTIVSAGKNIQAGTFAGSGSISISGTVSLSGAGTIPELNVTDSSTLTTSGGATLTALNVNAGTLKLNNNISVSGILTNAGIIDTNGKNLSFGTLSDTGTIKLSAAGDLSAGTSNQTVNNLVFTAGRTFNGFANIKLEDVELSAGILTLGSNVTVSGTFTNSGTVTINGPTSGSRSLTAEKYAGSGGYNISGSVQIASTGSGASNAGSVAAITTSTTADTTFTKSGDYTIDLFTVGSGNTTTFNSTLTVTNLTNKSKINLNGNLTITGTFDNWGGIDCRNKGLKFAIYQNTDTASTKNDSISLNGGSFESTGTASGSVANSITKATVKGTIKKSGTRPLSIGTVTANTSLTVTNDADGTLSFSKTVFSGNTTLSYNGTGASPVFSEITVNSSKVLTLSNDLTVGTLTNKGTVSSAGKNITCTTYTPSSTSADSMTLSGDVMLNVGTNKVSTISYGGGGILTAGAAGLKVGTLNVTAGTAVLAGTMNVTTLSVVGSTTVTGTVSATGSVTASADMTVSGSLSASSVAITGGSHTIDGTVTAGTYRATGLGGQILTVNGTLTVGNGSSATDTLVLKGSSATSKLSVTGSATGKIKLNASQIGGDYLDVDSAGPFITDHSGNDTVIYTATHSTPSDTEQNGWNFCQNGVVYVWKGIDPTSPNSWNAGRNWSVRIVPPDGSDVKIPSLASPAGTAPVTKTSAAITLNSLSVGDGMILTLGNNLTVSNGLTNNGTINTNGQSLKFKTYNETTTTGARLIKIGATNGLSSPTGTGGTISNIEFTATRNGQNGSANGFTDLQGLDFINAKVDAGVALTLKARAGRSSIAFTGTFENNGTVTLGNNVSITGALTNNGTIDMQNSSLSCGSYTDNTENGLVKLGTGTLFPGTGGTLKNIEFTASRDGQGSHPAGFENIANLFIKNGTVDPGVALTVTSRGLSFTGNFTNNGTITLNGNLSVTGAFSNKGAVTINNKALSFGRYSRIGTSDSISVNSGTITSAGNGGTITSASLKGTVTVKKTGTGALSLTTVTVTDDGSNLTITNDNGTGALSVGTTNFTGNATFTAGGTGSMPAFTTVSVGSGKTLTLGSPLAISSTLTNNGTISSSGYNLSAATVKNNGTITLTAGSGGNSITGTYTKDAGITSDKLILSKDVSLTIGTNQVGAISYSGGGTLTASETVNAGAMSVFGSSATLAGTMNISGGLTASSALTIAGGTSVGGNLTANSGLTVTGTVSVTGDLTASADVTVSGNTSVTGDLTATNCSVTVDSGKTLSAGTFTQTATSSGNALTVNGTLTVGSGKTTRDTFRITGVSGSLLTVNGDGSIQLNLSQVGGEYLDVTTSDLEVTEIPSSPGAAPGPDIVLSAIHSTGPVAPATALAGWYICSGDLIFVWEGGYGGNQTSWNEEHNWSVHIVPNAINAASNTEANIGPVIVKIPSVTYSPRTSGAVEVQDVTMDSGMSLTLNGNFTATNNLTSDGAITLQSGNMVVQNNLTNNGTITQNGNVSVTNVLTNTGTIDMKNNDLSCGSYADSTENGLIKLGTGTLSPGTGGTLKNIEFTATRDFENISNLTIVNGTIDASVALTVTSGGLAFSGTLISNGIITLNGNLSVTGALTNNGTIDMQNNDLTCASYTDDAADRFIKLGTGTFNPGSGGTLNNIEFTATRSFEDISGLTITNGKLNADQALTVTSGGLLFTGNFTNNGTITQNGDLIAGGRLDNTGSISIGSSALQFGWYIHTDTLDDALSIAGGSITSTGNGTGMLKINSLVMNGNATITNNGTGALRFEAATVTANALLTSGGSGSAPVYSNLLISGANTLTLASDVTAGTVTIDSSATLDADNRGKNADPNFAGYVLTVSGNFINNNSTMAETDNVLYRGFIPRSGKVEITGAGSTRHEIKGNIKFNDFTCHEPGASLVFDVGTTINVDHKIDVVGTAAQLIAMTTDSTVEGEKWTLDVIWDVAAGTPEHPKPVIKYVAPHKSISYSAILKGCLDNCVDDVNELLDSTNVNWFNDMPTILMTMAPVGGKQLFVLFSTEVSAASGTDLRTSLALKSGSSASIIDPTVPVTTYGGTSDKAKTAVVFGLTRNLTWSDLYGNDCLHVEVVQTGAVRVGTTRISYQQGVKHCTSDFAVNAARMLYGYDNYIDSATPLTAEKGVNSVRTWDQSDPISNRLHAESDLLFQAQFDSSVPEGTKLEMMAQLASGLNTSVIGDNYSSYYELSTRLWLPEKFQPICTDGQVIPSAQHIAQDATSSGRLRNFSLTYNASSSNPLFRMMDGEEIQFMFKVKNPDGTDLMIDHDYDADNGIYEPTPERPVYAIRLVDDSDIMSFDLWSVVLQETTLQRGNVTILNNVINSDLKEQTFVTIDMQKAGNLTVQVLTLDGAVVKTLQKGRKSAGTHGFGWDGTNGSGKPVARGMYFIRVIGPDIDETRKVMVVRN